MSGQRTTGSAESLPVSCLFVRGMSSLRGDDDVLTSWVLERGQGSGRAGFSGRTGSSADGFLGEQVPHQIPAVKDSKVVL